MAARTLHALSTSPLFLLLLFFAASSPTKAQQPYVNNHQLDCENRDFDNITNGFTCNGPRSCRSYLTFWSLPPYNTPNSIATLLNASAAEIQTLNNLTSLTTVIPTRRLVVIPTTCSCSGGGGFYQHNATYRLSGERQETYFSIANDTYQALSTCQAMMSQNPYGERNLTAGLNLLVPLRCACPTANQTAAGFRYLLTYLVAQGDSVSAIAEMFRSSTPAVSSGNELTSDNIYFFTPLLVPLRTEPTRIVITPPSPTPPVATPPQSPPVDPPGGSSSSHKWIYIGVGIGAGLLLLISILSLYFCYYKRRSKTSSLIEQNKLTDSSTKQSLPTTSSRSPLAVYKDTTSGDQTETDKSKPEFGSWLMLGGRAERNKENNALPGKWAAFKVPQKPIVRAAASSFEVFVDEKECTDERVQKKKKSETISSSSNVLPLNDGREIKK
uniref:LysM domain-containing protein n=1 Tax=Brassica campestris TaxID=3711 RepID=M4DZB4_BRACM